MTILTHVWVSAGYLLDSFEICTLAANFFLYFSFWLKINYLPVFGKTFKSLTDEPCFSEDRENLALSLPVSHSGFHAAYSVIHTLQPINEPHSEQVRAKSLSDD